MFERIVVPLDGSSLAEAILGQVRRLLSHKDAEVILVRAIVVPPSLEGMTVELPEILSAQATKYLEEIGRKLVSQGARVRSHARIGNAAEVIIDIANEERASLIAMTTHGRTGLARWALGSIAEKVLRASSVPVLAVRSFAGSEPDAIPTGAEELSLKKILVPVDSADLPLNVLPAARELAQLFGSQVLLLHVCEGPACTIPVPEMTKAHDEMQAAGVPVEPLMKQGNPAEQILVTCREHGADLIAMTTHGRAGVPRWMLGSVTEKVLRSSRVPLLIVRVGKVGSEVKENTPTTVPANTR